MRRTKEGEEPHQLAAKNRPQELQPPNGRGFDARNRYIKAIFPESAQAEAEKKRTGSERSRIQSGVRGSMPL
jgi:hypothetical protein